MPEPVEADLSIAEYPNQNIVDAKHPIKLGIAATAIRGAKFRRYSLTDLSIMSPIDIGSRIVTSPIKTAPAAIITRSVPAAASLEAWQICARVKWPPAARNTVRQVRVIAVRCKWNGEEMPTAYVVLGLSDAT